MKKFFAGLFLLGIVLSPLACGNSNSTSPAPVTVYVVVSPTPVSQPVSQLSWNTNGSLGVAVSGNYVWVGDYSAALDVYTLTGTPVTTIGWGVYNDGIVPDGSGGVYASGAGNSKICHSTSTFALTSFSTANYDYGLAIDNSGNLYSTDDSPSGHINKYTSAGAAVTSWTVPGGSPQGIAIYGSPQTIYVASTTAQEIYTYDLNGHSLPVSWAITGDGDSLGINQGHVYSGSYSSAGPMAVYTLTGTFLTEFGSFQAYAMGFDTSNNIYIGSGSTIQVYKP